LLLRSVTPAIIHELFNKLGKAQIIAYFGIDKGSYFLYEKMHVNGMETFRLSSFYFLLIDKKTDLPIGDCGFHTWNKVHNRAELFYTLRDDIHKQKGIMTEVLKFVLDYGFNELKLHRIEALVADTNIPSIKLLKRFNFSKEGTMREDYVVNGKNEDSDCYSLLKWEWSI